MNVSEIHDCRIGHYQMYLDKNSILRIKNEHPFYVSNHDIAINFCPVCGWESLIKPYEWMTMYLRDKDNDGE